MKKNKGQLIETVQIPELDRNIHSPGRLGIMTYLYIVDLGDATYLMKQTGLTWGNLSSHLSKLESVGYIEIIKSFIGKKPNTVIRLTELGRHSFELYREQMKDFIQITSIK